LVPAINRSIALAKSQSRQEPDGIHPYDPTLGTGAALNVNTIQFEAVGTRLGVIRQPAQHCRRVATWM
jgi:hypothetical protein